MAKQKRATTRDLARIFTTDESGRVLVPIAPVTTDERGQAVVEVEAPVSGQRYRYTVRREEIAGREG